MNLTRTAEILLITMLLSVVVPTYGQINLPAIKTPYGTVPATYHPMPMRTYSTGVGSFKHNFLVVLKNDSSFTCKARIDFSQETHSITYKRDEKKYTLKPSDTKTISWVTPKRLKILGLAVDSCWLFKIDSGKINSYSFLAEQNMLAIIAIQKSSDGPILPLNKDNLRGMVGEDTKTLKLVERNKLVEAIQRYNGKVIVKVVPRDKR